MPIAASFNHTIHSYTVDIAGNRLVLHIEFTDADDGTSAGKQVFFLPLEAGMPITDMKGRQVAAQTPSSTRTAETALRTDIEARVAAAVAAGKLKP